MKYTVLSSSVAHGELGENYNLGYYPYVLSFPEKGVSTISAHAPSKVEIEIEEEVFLRGYSSPDIEMCPILSFFCDDKEVGTLKEKGKKTRKILLSPGKHLLSIETSSLSWSHSVWILSKRFLNIDPRFSGRGLFNQYLNLLNCIILAAGSGRDIVNPQLEVDFNKNIFRPWGEFIDMEKLNSLLRDLEIDTQIRNIQIEKWEVDPHSDVMYGVSCDSSALIEYLSKEEENLSVGCALPLSISFSTEERELFYSIHRRIEYTPLMEEIVKYCMTFLGEIFTAVHLRAEDDWLYHLSQCHSDKKEHGKEILESYRRRMREVIPSGEKVYLATYLGKKENQCNYILDLLREEFNCVTNIPWRKKYNVVDGREVDALIDSLICRRARIFIGTPGSTFSEYTGDLVEKTFYV